MRGPREALRILRLSKGWTQEQAAQAVGYAGFSSWAMVETGRATPRINQMLHIAKIMGVSPDEIWEELQGGGDDHAPVA